MKTTTLKYGVISAVLIVLATSLQAFAAPIVKHEITVSAYGEGDFRTINEALSSITGTTSATNRYLITVKPGTYNEIVNMKPYVDIRGSGQENTKITSSAVGLADRCAYMGTVVMESNTRIENILVENTNTDNCPIAINITDKTDVIIDRVMAETKGTGDFASTPHQVGAIFLTSPGGLLGNTTIKNTTAIASNIVNPDHQTPPEFAGIMHFNGDSQNAVMNIDNVMAQCKAQQANSCNGMALWGSGGTFKVTNSTFKASSGKYVVGIDIAFGNVGLASFSHIISTADSGTQASYGISIAGGACTINNSEISGVTYGLSARNVKIGSSVIEGGVDLVRADIVKIVNCYDGNYDPIPNL